MKKLFSVLFILFGLSASAQVYVTQDNANQFRLFGGYGQFTQGFRLPIQGKTAYTATDSTGFIRYNDSDSSVKYFTGFQWITLPKTSGGSFDTTNIYAQLALKENLSNKTTSAVGTSNFLYPTQGAVYAQDLLRVLYTDTAAMLTPYATDAQVALKVNTSDFPTLFDNRLALKSTSDLAEGSNQYYTNAKVLGVINGDTGRSTSQLVTGGSLNKVRDSLAALNSGSVKYADTAAMLANYLKEIDTTGKFLTSVVKRNDSFFYVKAGAYVYFGKDSSGGAGTGVTYLWSSKITDHFEAAKITGVSDGAALNTWTNTGSGTLSNLTFDGTAPTYFTNYRGMPAVRFTRASSTSMTFTSQSFKQVVVVCNNVDGATFADYEGLMGNPVSGADWLWYADAASGTGMTQAGGDRIMTQAFETATNTFYPLSQTKITTYVSSAGISSRTTRVGAFWNLAGRYWNGYIQEMLFFSDVLTQEEYIALHQYLTAKYAVYKPVQLFVDGNSLFSGGYTGVTTAQGAGNRIILKGDTVTSSKVYSYNAAVGGTVTDQNSFNAATVTGIDYRQLYQPLFARQIDILYSATNQLAGSGDGLLYLADVDEYIAGRVAVNPNLEVWIPTILSCDSSYQLNSERVIVNNILRNKKFTKNYKVANIIDPIFDANGAFSNTAVFGDGIHLTATYADIWADQIIKQVFHYYAQE